MKKKFTFLLAGVIALSSFTIGVLSKGVVEKIEAEIRGDFEIVIDGKTEVFRNAEGKVVYPILHDGTTYLPVRAIGKLMGKMVYWYQDEKRIELVEPGKETLVTDADVIIDGAKEEKVKSEKTGKVDKNEKLKEAEVDLTLEEAKKLVLKKAGVKESDAVFTKAKLDNDDGRWVYDIDFKTDGARYDAEVDAINAVVTEWEIEKRAIKAQEEVVAEITLEKAKKIALDKVGLKEKDVIFEEAKLDNDDGIKVYDIEFRHERTEYSFEIDAASGKILEWEKDND